MTVKTRKEHECCICGEVIAKGEQAHYGEERVPKFDDRDCQIGIEYLKYWHHTHRCDLSQEQLQKCESGDHEWEPEYLPDGYVGCHAVYYPTGKEFCLTCGIPKAA